ncbi:hypothetical protein JHJ32_05495 [Parapedobacter sp. ISTM3]|uniref:hypothetical protein n=1 Tax=Parapedobacter sp. ISTM3 TaxID=2800130 RepID=UPI001908104A|nr:hypothetical protein [Parapedobacter sp. ISTM3]MBK1439431.1 hypothetical protein [Parapedobacter sp. ISTM3]
MRVTNSLITINVFFILISYCFFSCSGEGRGDEDPRKPSFVPIVGIDFYEVRRSFDNGLAYDSIGFVQEPEWHIKFTREDAVQIYVPGSDSSFNFQITHDHDSFFHFARESWKVIDLHPDSMMLQRLSLDGLKVNKIRSNVYMRFYSKDYLNQLATPLAELRKPRKYDSLFVRKMVQRANNNPANVDSSFSSKNYPKLVSKSPLLEIKRRRYDSLEVMGRSPAYAYLYPEYDIVIHRAYKDFDYTFSMLVGPDGKLRLGKFFVMPEFEESRRRVLSGIIDVYLQNLLDVTPATTLGLPHNSVVYLRVQGKAS